MGKEYFKQELGETQILLTYDLVLGWEKEIQAATDGGSGYGQG